ncbi:MAG: translation elongation factor 4 [Endomicrobium sp.]|jgi:GTP-binding protein LepA|nr:translation elongation factor 4 [Endomicrobium sp.]
MLNIKNFCIIAHIDHGKSTIADRLLEYTKTISDREMKNQILDEMDLEREKGITIKAKTVRMDYTCEKNEKYVFNLIDTPGHVDFTYEVSRALAACDGAILIVDATNGVRSQTIANTILAKNAKLKIIPVINKIDLPAANIDNTCEQIKKILEITTRPILASAKTGVGIKEIINSIILEIPSAETLNQKALSALIFDSFYDLYRGIIIIVRVFEGKIKRGMKIKFMASNVVYEVLEVGYMKLKMINSCELLSGEVGYVIAGIKDVHYIKIGDTITDSNNPTEYPHEGYKEINPFVFASFYPNNISGYDSLKTSLEKLKLSDSSITFSNEISSVLGPGFRCGFLGSLHLDIIVERLKREFNLNVFVTAPSVIYKIKLNNKFIKIDSPSKFPNYSDIKEIWEPYVKATIICPVDFLGSVFDLCCKNRGKQISAKYSLDAKTVILIYHMPLSEIIVDFYDSLKSISRGYASFDYEHIDLQLGDLVKLEVMINAKIIDAFTSIIYRNDAKIAARHLAEKLKSIIPRHMFEIPIQVMINNRIIARETISAIRKDVLAKCYGGDITRKRKLLEKQKEGKQKMKKFGMVNIPSEAFIAVLKMNK